jgi:phosphomannomutase
VLEVIEENGGVGLRSRVGHSYIKKMMAESKAIFGGEHSGHFYFDEFWRADSGALAALHAIAALGESKKSMSAILKPYQRYVPSGEINSKVSDAAAASALVEQVFIAQNGVTIDHLDGLSINGDSWWFNLRPSNTEPLLRLNVEAKTTARMEKLRDEVLALIRR